MNFILTVFLILAIIKYSDNIFWFIIILLLIAWFPYVVLSILCLLPFIWVAKSVWKHSKIAAIILSLYLILAELIIVGIILHECGN